jgi:hypothetical protein
MESINKKIEMIAKTEKRHNEEMEFLKGLPEDIFNDVLTISHESVFLYTTHSYQDFKKQLTKISHIMGCGYELEFYYISGSNELCIHYNINNIPFYFYTSDIDTTLNKISKGKCKIEHTTKEEIEVVCSLG